MELRDLTAQAVMEVMDKHSPGWEAIWADQRDLVEALTMPEAHRKEFLQSRASSQIMLVLRAAHQLTKESCDASIRAK